ncbi:hypothetical protein CO115_03635 [Candidatus Falkowbacteria bacterium CG_4_9_14_3_um_filter_36_9]|uniref:Transposase IS200-like domain-containing protein n=1 Tax=Candidatus Falkowbacteria bacterium CG02_land_8_20_14_3_00_36_14 TaxID=1974560 RepID=A0A2M7DLE5_9BACT|nr:MAG: hypothetical protein COS18_04550 [Candidatus Falkowbacteria bacterium CG02_land_8_20_14_3_00_36_14]PIX12263.1 MAG: hypothetical protein COZ73_00590 [Candidatus Falkowbacteria bacterium CG_4_8_14_3_um_filter_36_11]PJA10902.1 MAG: hypothetical protein COX67_02615 [Candidatus Falkowbacteria bacterium CG_4_10_14_0_2_um_filter_36_22]PJB18879.1 MAG: hypothetical protein CO115_03635 [Candidatus Falkowbacteria bacterium CG_4_9_14_3_um_filter_36_9]
MTDHIIKRHNKTVILYHLICPTKYRKKVFTEEVEKTLKEVFGQSGAAYFFSGFFIINKYLKPLK